MLLLISKLKLIALGREPDPSDCRVMLVLYIGRVYGVSDVFGKKISIPEGMLIMEVQTYASKSVTSDTGVSSPV